MFFLSAFQGPDPEHLRREGYLYIMMQQARISGQNIFVSRYLPRNKNSSLCPQPVRHSEATAGASVVKIRFWTGINWGIFDGGQAV
jgi:hypothetical protein